MKLRGLCIVARVGLPVWRTLDSLRARYKKLGDGKRVDYLDDKEALAGLMGLVFFAVGTIPGIGVALVVKDLGGDMVIVKASFLVVQMLTGTAAAVLGWIVGAID